MKILLLILAIFTCCTACEKTSVQENIVNKTTMAMFNDAGFDNSTDDIKKTVVPPLVFIAGFDEDDNTFYTTATTHFKNKNMNVIEGLYSLPEVIIWLNENYKDKPYGEIHIVSHSNAWRGMSLKINKNGDRITAETLQNAINLQEIPTITSGVIKETKVIFHSCGLGSNESLLKLLKTAFSSTESPQIVASPYFNVFGGKYEAHFLAKPYYVYYPTAHSPGPLALSREIKTTYPDETIDWFTALKTREETVLGEAYSYRFNIPVVWEIAFNDISEIPQLENRDAIMDFVSENDEMALALYELNIPLEKFRWQAKISEENTTLTIKGKTTVLCVLDPVMDANDEGNYVVPKINNQDLYSQL